MSKKTQKPNAPVSARKPDRKDDKAAKAVEEQPKADGYDLVREMEDRMVRAAYEAATEVYRKASEAGRQEDDADLAGFEVFTIVRLAAEAAAAKAAGYETWAAYSRLPKRNA